VQGLPEGRPCDSRSGRYGAGIPDDLDVFQLFKTTKPEGTGLGLPIVEQIVSEHHGTVVYTTEPGKGTVFVVSLPL
jgi:signal transduction histidine kinase